MARGKRRILGGIIGAPGVGRTPYALAQVMTSGAPAAYVPMDGFPNGAPDTFDALGCSTKPYWCRRRPAKHEVGTGGGVRGAHVRQGRWLRLRRR
jgi:hypothetical protein